MQTEPIATTEMATQDAANPDRRWRRGLRHGLRTRKLPFRGGKSIQRYRDAYRVAIEDELRGQGREIGALEATIVAAAVVAYEHALKAGFWLAFNHDQLNHDQRLKFSSEELKGMESAAKLLKSLGIDRKAVRDSDWDALKPATEGKPNG